MKLYDEIAASARDDGLPMMDIPTWERLTEKYGKTVFRRELAHFIHVTRPPFPLKKIGWVDMVESFRALCGFDTTKIIKPAEQCREDIVEKYDDYQYPFSDFGVGYLDGRSMHMLNNCSNYFHQDLRYACDGANHKSPISVFSEGTEQEIFRNLSPIWRGINEVETVDVDGKAVLKNGRLTELSYRSAFRLGAYIPQHFKPVSAKALCDMTKAKIILDTSCGWGDRLCAFYASDAHCYIGCDPNPAVFARYKDQCIEYEKLLTGHEPKFIRDDELCFALCGMSGKTVRIHRCGAEDLSYGDIKNVDLAFTSPPYFATELYNKGGKCEEDQSWFKFSEYDSWYKDFFLPVCEGTMRTLSEHGFMFINIMDPKIKGERNRTSDSLVNAFRDQFICQIGMRISQRPQGRNKYADEAALLEFMGKIYIENIWCFQKNPTQEDLFEHARHSTLEEFM